MDELLVALRAEFPGLEWQSFSPFGAGYPHIGYRADVPGGSMEAGEVEGEGRISLRFTGGEEEFCQGWWLERAAALARFHRKLRLAAKAVEVADG